MSPETLPPKWYHFQYNSLVYQTFLLMCTLMLVALLSWILTYRYFFEPIRAKNISNTIISVTHFTQRALKLEKTLNTKTLLSAPLKKKELLILPQSPDLIIETYENPSSFVKIIIQKIRTEFGNNIKFAKQINHKKGFWLLSELDEESLDEGNAIWICFPISYLNDPLSTQWTPWVIFSVLISILFAYAITMRIATPLSRLTKTAILIGQGSHPPPLDPKAPKEISTVISAFNKMNDELIQAESNRSMILASVSHDLRTPLARLRLGIELSNIPEDDLKAMVMDIEDMDKIIGQFLDFGRFIPQEPTENINLTQLIIDIIQRYTLLHIRIDSQLEKNLIISGLRVPIQRAISNLIDNAIKYAGIKHPIDIKLSNNGRSAVIVIADKGPGIPPKEVNQMKKPFTQMQIARTEAKGAGLGLAIVERIMKWHNGSLDLLPRSGGGLLAVLKFPIQNKNTQPKQH